MANVLQDPLAAAAAADVPNAGAPAAPAGDSAGANPFAGLNLPTEVVPPTDDPAQQSAPAPAPAPEPNPFSGIQVGDPSQGTATAAGSLGGGGQAPSGVVADTANPFSGLQLGTETPVEPAVKPVEKNQGLGTAVYQGAKSLALHTVEDLSNAVQLMWNNPGAMGGHIGVPVMVPLTWDQERANSGMRGMAMIGTGVLPGAETIIPALGEGFFTKTLTGKVLALIANGQVAGASYGAAAPLESDQTRWESIRDNTEALMLQVPLMHGAFKLLGWPIGAALKKLGIPQKVADAMRRPDVTPEHIAEAAKQTEELLQTVKDNGANPAHLPEEVKENLVAMSIHNAVDQPELNNLDDRTAAWEQASQETHGVTEISPRTFGTSEPAPQVAGLTTPREVQLPEPNPGQNQTRVAQGVYQNPDGSIDAYGYRGVSNRAVGPGEYLSEDEINRLTPGGQIRRGATDPGLMNTLYISPNPQFAAGFGKLHYVGARFEKPLIIDNWHDPLADRKMEARAKLTTEGFKTAHEAHLLHPEYGNVNYLGERQPGVIDAARDMGYDAIIVRHGNEAVEIVALKPEKVYSAGAAPAAAANQAGNDIFDNTDSFEPATPQQQHIADRARRNQRGVADLGTSNANLAGSTALRNGQAINQYHSPSAADQDLATKVMDLIKQHVGITEFPDDATGGWGNHLAGTYKMDNRILSVTPSAKSGYDITDVTGRMQRDAPKGRDIGLKDHMVVNASSALQEGDVLSVNSSGPHDQRVYADLSSKLGGQDAGDYQIGGRIIRYDPQGKSDITGVHPTFQDVTQSASKFDPTVHPDIVQAALLHDAIGKAATQMEMKSMLGESNAAAAEKLAGYEPQPRGFGKESQIKRLDIHGEGAVNKAAVGQIDDALLDLTAPRELDLEHPELSNVGKQTTKLPKEFLNRDVADIEKEILPERAKQRAAVEQNYSSAEKRGPGRVVLEPWERELLGRYRDMLNMVKRQAVTEVPKVESYISELLDNARARAEGAAEKGTEYQVGMVDVTPSTQERAPWSPVPAGIAVPQMPDDFAMLARMTMAQRDGIGQVTEIPGLGKAADAEPPKLPPRSQRSLTGKSSGGNRTGATNFSVMFRVASGGSSALLYGVGVNTQDPKTRKLLLTASGVLGFLAFMPKKGGWFDKSAFGEALMKMNDLPAFMKATVGPEAEQKFRDATDLVNYWNGTSKTRGMLQSKMFPSVAERELFARALDDPNNAAVWAKLSPEQAQFVGQEGIINHMLGQMLKAKKIIDNFRDDYVRHMFPDETFNAWRSAKGSLNPGGFTKPRVFNTLQDAENWARANNLPGPILDGVQLQARHFQEVGRALMAKQIVDDMKGLGLLIDRGKVLPSGWMSPRVNGMADLVAPEAVALGLERLGNYRPGILDSQFLKGLDTIKSWQMRMVMAFPWIHGINVVRGALALDGTGISYVRAMNALQAADPSVARALKSGVRLFDRPDFAPRHAEGFAGILDKLGNSVGPTLGNATFNPASAALQAGEHALWDKWVPSLGLGAFNREMYNWTERTGGKFAEGTPEFKAASRAAADFANTIMGKSLDTMKDPGLTYMLRNIFFAPQWMASRMRISAAALGEMRGLSSGEIAVKDMKYLPYKIRSLLIGATFTYVASRLWSGKDPVFNPNNNKFYIRTGVYDQNKREVGVDVAGWWADDIKMFGDPAKYFMNRLSPMIQATHTAISGRDAFGRSIGGLELVDELANEFGPISSMTDVATRMMNKHGTMSGADAIKGVLGSTDIGSSASIPRQSDLVLQGLAYRILRQQGLPQDDDRVYALQQIMASNQRQGKPIVDGAVVTWIAYQRRSYGRQFPTPAGVRYLWRESQSVLRNMTR